jgi:HAD superfamily hydrolase (TIGR01509 family)
VLDDGVASEVLVIFDLDGTLVDSEMLCNQAFMDLLPGLPYSVEELTERFRGRKLDQILSVLSKSVDVDLDAAFVAQYRERVAELFESDLLPQRGAAALLAVLEQRGVEFCVASSAPRPKIGDALRATDLDTYFSDDRIYSSYEVLSWKPSPGLFLHVAKDRGRSVSSCIVVEDSQVGLEAAEAAGMNSVLFDPSGMSPVSDARYRISHLGALLEILESH